MPKHAAGEREEAHEATARLRDLKIKNLETGSLQLRLD